MEVDEAKANAGGVLTSADAKKEKELG